MTSSSRFRTSTTEEIALLLLLLPERATARVASFPRQKTAQDGRIQEGRPLHVRLGSLADISERTRDVRFTPESGHAELQHRRPLSARSRHMSAVQVADTDRHYRSDWMAARRAGGFSQPGNYARCPRPASPSWR